MSALVKWLASDILVSGVFPTSVSEEDAKPEDRKKDLSKADFEGDIDNEIEPNFLIGYTTIDASKYTEYGMTSYVMPEVIPVVKKVCIPTIDWLRNHLGEASEIAIRSYGLNDQNANYIDVQVFMDMIRDRASVDIIVSDPQYKVGIELIKALEIISKSDAESLLALGNHTPSWTED
jgi:hypothetical protein